ncbi:S-adenosylmethionine decarboxylase proenzyme-like [Nymphaea colorata]|uniref:S-adenosylmethionine decarboxylase proenzyme-like n=1 Tax=Nymphaea colorata TaxID=210225 RepID=UPI00129D6C93|nr:S-adenosylmethionine decarboxylase proenzyme-like [Nymphaea colorata]
MAAIGFEGYEKRLEIVFCKPSIFADPDGKGLRALCRPQIDEFLSAAECTIVDNLSNSVMDSYVLSESSLFIHPYKIIIKTCGTTKLLRAIPIILRHAGSLSLSPISVKYSRGTFIFPAAQPSPHSSFSEEVAVLDSHFGQLFSKPGEAYVIDGGNPARNWHIYWSSLDSAPVMPLTMEMCMTNLDTERASVFYKNTKSPGKTMTDASGIANILPDFEINDFEFEPCGYSMNSINGNALSTIHVTPEDGFSYASFEFVDVIDPNMALNTAELEAMIGRVLDCFGPSEFSIAMHCSSNSPISKLSKRNGLTGYACGRVVEQELVGGGCLVYQSFSAADEEMGNSPKSILQKWIDVVSEEVDGGYEIPMSGENMGHCGTEESGEVVEEGTWVAVSCLA